MYAVGRIGSYISRGVYTVSAPFHPFGGAVDIIVVQQQDGSFKSSPWYVRFGKFQGVLKSKEKVVNISVNGVDADFHMYLDNKGEAYFLREADVEEVDPVCCISSSGEEADEKPYNRRHVKSKSCDYDFDQANSVTEISLSDGKILARTNSRKSRLLGFMFGRKSMKRDGFPKEVDSRGVCRTESLERAEIAADLLEVKWSTNSPSDGCHKDVDPTSCVLPISDGNADKGLQIDDQENKVEPVETNSENVRSHEEERLQVLQKMYSSNSTSPGTESFRVESGVEMSCSVAEYVVDETGLGESYLVDNKEVHVKMSSNIHEFSTAETDQGAYRMEFTSETPDADYQILDDAKVEAEVSSKEKLEKEKVVDGKDDCSPDGGGAFGEYNGAIEADSSVYCGTSESSIVELESNGEQAKESLHIPYGCGEVCAEAETLNEMTGLISEVSCQPEAILQVAKEYFGIEGGYRDDNCCKPLNDAIVLENEEISPCSLSNNTVTETYSQILTIHQVNGSEEEQLPFGELDDFKSGGVACIDSNLPDPAANEIHLSFISRTIETSDKPVSSLPEANSSPEKFIQKNLPNDEDLRIRPKRVSSEIDIPTSGKVVGEEDGRIVKSMPSFWIHNKNACDLSESSEILAQNESFQEQAASTNTILEDLKTVPSTFGGDPSKVNDASGGSWRIWSFPFKKSQSMKEIQSDLNNKRNPEAENYSKSSSGIEGGKDGSKPKVSVKEIRVLTPTTEELASLNLKEGRNEVVFAFSTAMLGNQQVDARIYLWRWDTRIVISDVDGTITKSDVLGQFMPLVGRDWSQTGVTHFFSAIKENGYQFLFLSARSISQAYRTRQFLFNLKQEGKALPDGPVVISPDGLFPSLFREVFRRAPHEFKIACLEEIKALFASDRNPYYAGFGNRDTDEISYLKVGIPKGKIFIINPKGEVSAHRRVDTKSYTSLNTLVNGMFPSISSYEQEDFNSWNYWRLPSPSIDI